MTDEKQRSGRLRAGIIGMGYIGVSHVEAVRRIGGAELVAVADANAELARRKAEEFCVPVCAGSIDELLADESIDIVHNCTPNNLHSEVNRKILEAGKHVLSEKPLARTYAEAAELAAYAGKFPGLAKGVNFNYRFNPLVRDIRAKVAAGELGTPWLVHGSYLQDWLLYQSDYNWRIEPEVCGPSRCVADIGSHWMDCVQHVLGSRICEVCADIGRVFDTRLRGGQVETFSESAGEGEEVPVRTEDYASVIFRMENGVRGVYHTSEVSAGHGCWFTFEINGSKASAMWNQESADRLWLGYRGRGNVCTMRDPAVMAPEAVALGDLAKGHPEGWNDAFKNGIAAFYEHVRTGRDTGFATFENGAYILRLTEAILESADKRGWVTV